MNVTQIFEEALLAYIRCNHDASATQIVTWEASERGGEETIVVDYLPLSDHNSTPPELGRFIWGASLYELMQAVDGYVEAALINKY